MQQRSDGRRRGLGPHDLMMANHTAYSVTPIQLSGMRNSQSFARRHDGWPYGLFRFYSGTHHFDGRLTGEASGWLSKRGIDFCTDWYTPQPRGTAIQIHAKMRKSFFIDPGLSRFNAVKLGMNWSDQEVGDQADDQQTCHHVHGGIVGLGFGHSGFNL